MAWKYEIASRWNLDPRSVEDWDAEEVLEALARMGLEESERKKQAARDAHKARGRRGR